MQKTAMFAVSVFFVLLIAGCLGYNNSSNQPSVGDEATSSVSQELTMGSAKIQTNLALIKQRAAQKGITNFFLLALIAWNETTIAQCKTEWNLPIGCTNVGTSSDCPASLGGVLGGASDDGGCSSMNGGIGMFQLDKGTYTQTTNGWANTFPGYDVMTTIGNIDAAIKFVISRLGFACAETPVFYANLNDGITPTQTTYTPADEALVVQWLNGTSYGSADFQTFLQAEVVCYNGAAKGSSLYNTRLSDYTSNASLLYNYFGQNFWSAGSSSCQNSGPFSSSGSNGQNGTTCLATYNYPVVAGNTYCISTCGSFSGDTYLKTVGACICNPSSNDDFCSLGSQCDCTATFTGMASICASSYSNSSASWNYTVTCQNSPNSNYGPFVGSGSNGGSGTICLATYNYPVVAGHTYRISTCGSYSGDTYLKATGACICQNDDSCGLGSQCDCTATSTGMASICASSWSSASAAWNYMVTPL